jgi:hypothetical protein
MLPQRASIADFFAIVERPGLCRRGRALHAGRASAELAYSARSMSSTR